MKKLLLKENEVKDYDIKIYIYRIHTCQATPSLEISLPDMPSVRFAISEHFIP